MPGTPAPERVDLRDGYRIEVEPMIAPAGAFGARLYWRVPPDSRTAHAAVAWTFDMTPAEYRLAVAT